VILPGIVRLFDRFKRSSACNFAAQIKARKSSPKATLIRPIGETSKRPRLPFAMNGPGQRISGPCTRQVLLNIRREKQQIHSLRHSRSVAENL